jgi:hypothetical protein
LADIVALVLNLLVLAAFGGLVYMLLSPLLSDGHGDGWGRSSTSPYFDAVKDGGIMSRVLNSIDYVDTTFAVMKIQGDGCRKRIACEMERTAGRNKIFNYATGWFRYMLLRISSFLLDILFPLIYIPHNNNSLFSFYKTSKLQGQLTKPKR